MWTRKKETVFKTIILEKHELRKSQQVIVLYLYSTQLLGGAPAVLKQDDGKQTHPRVTKLECQSCKWRIQGLNSLEYGITISEASVSLTHIRQNSLLVILCTAAMTPLHSAISSTHGRDLCHLGNRDTSLRLNTFCPTNYLHREWREAANHGRARQQQPVKCAAVPSNNAQASLLSGMSMSELKGDPREYIQV